MADKMRRYVSPLRYPGGKARMAGWLDVLFRQQWDHVEVWMEPFAGGAGAGLTLLDADAIPELWLVEKHPALAAFWTTLTQDGHRLANHIRRLDPTMTLWHHSKSVLAAAEAGQTVDQFDLAVAAFVTNRCSRSGITTSTAGPIGGKHQTGAHIVASRFNPDKLADRLARVADLSGRIRVWESDAVDMITELPDSGFDGELFLFVDPPYVIEGGRLYQHSFGWADHARLRDALAACGSPWMLTYDHHPHIQDLYAGFPQLEFGIDYSANTRRSDVELAVFSHTAQVPAELNVWPGKQARWAEAA